MKMKMKMKALLMCLGILAVMLSAAACNKATFSSAMGNNGKVENLRKEAAQGTEPAPGKGDEVILEPIELTCENSQGVIIEIGDVAAVSLTGSNDDKTSAQNSSSQSNGEKKDDNGKKNADEGKDDKQGKKGDSKDPGDDDKDPSDDPIDDDHDPIDDDKDIPKDDPKPTPPAARVQTSVRGEFCPEATNRLTVLFVIDFSGSMGKHRPLMGTIAPNSGNDPLVDGTCGRLNAAKAIYGYLKDKKLADDKIKLGMIPFAGTTLPSYEVEIQDFDSFEDELTKEKFCSYISPYNYPGAINGREFPDALTNYKAALTRSEDLLKKIYGRKVIYFITDGEPTTDGKTFNLLNPKKSIDNAHAAAREAGENLQARVDNLIINALLLGVDHGKAQSLLQAITGSDARVRLIKKATDLAKEILKFTDKAEIDTSTGQALLKIKSLPDYDIGFDFFDKDPARDAVWTYETKPFVLKGIPGKVVDNLVEITAKDHEGKVHSASVIIKYRQ